MTFKEGLIAARSRIVILLGLLTTAGIIWQLEAVRSGRFGQAGQSKNGTSSSGTLSNTSFDANGNPMETNVLPPVVQSTAPFQPATPDALTDQEREWARVAWKYFENNYQPATGLVNSVDNYTAATMWDTGSYLMAVIDAHKLGVITESVCTERLQAALNALQSLPLYDNELPNKSYNTTTKEMVDYANQKTPRGIGWSVVDVGRLFVPLHSIAWDYPQFTGQIKTILARLKFTHALQGGVMYGAVAGDSSSNNKTAYPQEGRLGYEEYAAKSFELMGKDVAAARRYDDFLHYERIYEVDIATDSRTPDRYKAFNYVVSEPYILDGVEFGFDDVSRELAYRVYKVQEERFARTGVLTAVSEDNIDTAPYFVYNTVFTAGKAWNCITDKGEDVSQFRSVSTKAAFGWYALYRTEYTKKLIESIKTLYNPDRGWYSGVYERTGKPNTAITANTNAIILESLRYKQNGARIRLLR